MSDGTIAHHDLLARVAVQLSKTHTSTDHLMLTKWRVLSTCQYLLGEPEAELEAACMTALEMFAVHGAGAECDSALEAAGAQIKRVEGTAQTALPSISKGKRIAVLGQLDALATRGAETIEQALRVLPDVRKRMTAAAEGAVIPGLRHRFELVADVLQARDRSEIERVRAAAAVLYVDEVSDVIPDTLGALGLLDDDYALRVVLGEFSHGVDSHLHWSEKISSLWDDLPFLRGVNLQRDDGPVSVTWLDRANAFVSYTHVMRLERSPLLLLQPSVACSPLHAIVSLIGLLVLDAVTSSQNKAQALRVGQTYEIAGCFVRFEGTSPPPMAGWLRLRVRNGVIYKPPGLADRMVAVDPRRLSSDREFASRPRSTLADPMQRFFDWDAAIGPSSISSRLVLVASRKRALDLLEGVQSNGVRLLDHGLVRFVGAVPNDVDTHGTLVLVAPSLSATRVLLAKGLRLQAVLVDGYERLHRGRHELPFLVNGEGSPPIIAWSATGYYPAQPPSWLPPHKRLEVSPEDLAGILELDDAGTDPARASLWEAATGINVRVRTASLSVDEQKIVDAIDVYAGSIQSSEHLPEYWRYHLTTLVRTLRILIAATPAQWSEIGRFASSWSSSIEEKWTTLRASAVAALSTIRDEEKRILDLIAAVPVANNTVAVALQGFLSDTAPSGAQWYLACDRLEQTRVAAAMVRVMGLKRIEPVLLRDLTVCRDCVVAGWVSSSFARRLWAHTPKTLVALVDDRDRQRWERAAEAQRHPVGQSLLAAVGGHRVPLADRGSPPPTGNDPDNRHVDDADADWSPDDGIPCVFLWLAGESEARVLARDSRVVVEEDDAVSERIAARLRSDDRVILGLGTSRWSPADEFTQAVIGAVQASHPQLVKAAREWRRALRQLRDAQGLATAELRSRLLSIGVEREGQTLDGWLDLERAAPIAPRGSRKELTSLWPIISPYAEESLDDVVSACTRLRALRAASGRALLQLWKGRGVDLGIDESSLDALVDRLRQEVHVYEVDAVTLGSVPPAMLGWKISPAMAGRFESESGQTSVVPQEDPEDMGAAE